MRKLTHDSTGERLPASSILTTLARTGTYIDMLRVMNAPAYRDGICALVAPILHSARGEELWVMESREDIRAILALENTVVRWVHIPTTLELLQVAEGQLLLDSPEHLTQDGDHTGAPQ